MINLDKPLVHCAEDDRRLAPPTVGVTVVIVFLMQERFAQPQLVQHGFIRIALAMLFENGLAQHFAGHLLLDRQIDRMRELAVIIHGRINRQAIFHAEEIIVLSMPGSDVHETGASRVIDKTVARKEFASAIAKRMLILDLAQMPAVETAHNFVAIPSTFLRYR